MIQISDSPFGDRIIQRKSDFLIVAHDIRTVDVQAGVLELDPAKAAINRQRSPPKEGQVVEPNARDIERVHRVGEVIAGRLQSHGFSTIEAVATADHSELMQVTGIGQVRAREIRQSAKQLLGVVC